MKNNNAVTINLNDEYKNIIDKLATFYQRKTADYLRVILQPLLLNEYAKMQLLTGEAKNDGLQAAIFKQ